MPGIKTAAVWFVCGLLGVMTLSSAASADEKALPSQFISSIKFKGAEHFSAKELEQYTNLAAGMAFDADKASDDCAAIVRHYQEHGYPFVSCSKTFHGVTAVAEGGLSPFLYWCNSLTYTINEGPKVKVKNVEFIGNQYVSSDVLAEQLQCHKRGSSRANFAAVQSDVIGLTEYYRSFGYLDATVTYELQWNLDGGEAVIMFHIHEGEH
jgi:outer membrane protein insertion porin family